MINDKPNMSRKQIFDELPVPDKIDAEKLSLKYLYKGIYIIIKLLLDLRLNMVKLSEGKPIKTKHKEYRKADKPNTPVDNAVIKDSDSVEIEKKEGDK